MKHEGLRTKLRRAFSKRVLRSNRVLFVYEIGMGMKGHGRRFTDLDILLLQRAYHVRRLEYNGLLRMIRDFGPFGLVRLVRSSDCIVSYWGDIHSAFFSLLGNLLGRPTIVISGGYDVVRMPEIGYGLGEKVRGRIYAYMSFHLGRKIVVNSRDSKETVVRNYRISPRKVETIYHGIDVFGSAPNWNYENKRRLVITVGRVSWINLRRKGISTFVRSAMYLPTVDFEVIGEWIDDSIEYLKKAATVNVTFKTNVNDRELVETYRHAKVVVQASYHEGFGCALAEAMSFGCVPVVTRRGALPEVVGETGYYVEYGKAEDLARAMVFAMNDEKRATLASERAKRLFKLNERQRRLFEVVEEVLAKR